VVYKTRFIHYLILVTNRITIRVVPQNSRIPNAESRADWRCSSSACVWMEREPRRQSDWSLSAFVRNSSAAPGTLPGRQTQRDHPVQKNSLRLTHRPIIEGKRLIVGSSVSLLICFQWRMTSADSCFFLLQEVVKRESDCVQSIFILMFLWLSFPVCGRLFSDFQAI